jgi:DeoR/GlpR family transcriptional regulator of sugar metabolism
VKRALAPCSTETVVLASKEKLNAASAYAIGDVTLAQTVVVERSTDAALTGPLEAAGVTVIRA